MLAFPAIAARLLCGPLWSAEWSRSSRPNPCGGQTPQPGTMASCGLWKALALNLFAVCLFSRTPDRRIHARVRQRTTEIIDPAIRLEGTIIDVLQG
ncbi:MAG: hypothetical protein PHG00_09365, partial [Methylococcales bacterium]|nr:hypothetical protein [Methylococcales bacterium]